jgi:HK97 family phage major capsid protein
MTDQIKELNTQLKTVSDEIKTYAEKADKEIKAHASMTAETRSMVDKLLLTQSELQNQLSAAMQKVDAIPASFESQRPKSWGQSVVEHKDQFDAMLAANNPRASAMVNVNASLTNDGLDIAQPYRIPQIAELGRQRMTIRDLLRWGRVATNTNSVEFWRQATFSNQADVVSENPSLGKPKSTLTGSMQSAPVATIAHWFHASKQVLSDAPMLQSLIDVEARYGVMLKEEEQLLFGSGTGLEINGLYTQASAYVEPTGVDITQETRVDRLRLALLQAELANYYADGIVLSLVDWANIELQKDGEFRYLMASPFGMITPTLWGRPVVASKTMTTGDFLVGAFQTGAMGWDREQLSVSVSFEDQDNFIKNMVTILAEERIALTVKQTAAFVKGDFDGLAS